MLETLSRSDRELLKTIYRLSKDSAGAPTGAVADRMGLSPGTITAAIKRLAEKELLDHRPYKGAVLTETGRRAAIAAIRRHRIVERFLADMLGYAWNEADRLAGTFEHDLPQEVEDRLFVALDRPSACPHGFPIPALDADEVPDTPPLYSLEPGDEAVVAVPGSTDADVIDFLENLGLRPGVRVRIKEKHPFDGPLVLRVAGKDRTVGEKVASQIFVRRESTGTPGPTG